MESSICKVIPENKYKDRFRKQIGNYFKSVYDADKYLTILESKKGVIN